MARGIGRVRHQLEQELELLNKEARELAAAMERVRGEADRIRAALRSLDQSSDADIEVPVIFTRRRQMKPKKERLEEIVSYLREHPGSRAADVATGCGLNSSRTYQLLKDLVSTGRVRKERLRYTMAPEE